jgi:hypothetical protein
VARPRAAPPFAALGTRRALPVDFVSFDRLVLQLLMTIVMAIRAGWRDARENRPPFLWTG